MVNLAALLLAVAFALTPLILWADPGTRESFPRAAWLPVLGPACALICLVRAAQPPAPAQDGDIFILTFGLAACGGVALRLAFALRSRRAAANAAGRVRRARARWR